jgi:hypothetical protein
MFHSRHCGLQPNGRLSAGYQKALDEATSNPSADTWDNVCKAADALMRALAAVMIELR